MHSPVVLPLHAAAIVALLAGCRGPASTANQSVGAARPVAVTTDTSSRRTHGTLRSDSLRSLALGVEKRVVVYLPPSYSDTGRRFPVAYYLHGMWGSERDWADQARLAHVADSLIAAGMPELIVVLPDGDNGYYTDWATRGDVDECRRQPPVREAAETYCVPSPRYEQYMTRDVVPWVDSTFRTLAGPSHRGVAGLSMGGYGAITLALRHPDIWSAAASHSGVLSLLLSADTSGTRAPPPGIEALERQWGPRFWPLIVPVFGRDTAGWWAREPARLAARRAAAGPPVPALFIDVGTSDALALGGNRHFRDELRRLGLAAEYREWPGGHTWTYWRTHLPESLRWLSGQLDQR